MGTARFYKVLLKSPSNLPLPCLLFLPVLVSKLPPRLWNQCLLEASVFGILELGCCGSGLNPSHLREVLECVSGMGIAWGSGGLGFSVTETVEMQGKVSKALQENVCTEVLLLGGVDPVDHSLAVNPFIWRSQEGSSCQFRTDWLADISELELSRNCLAPYTFLLQPPHCTRVILGWK